MKNVILIAAPVKSIVPATLIGLLLISAGQADYQLDLTSRLSSSDEQLSAVPTNERLSPRPVVGPPADGGPPRVLPYAVTTPVLNRSDYSVGDEFYYEFDVRNISKKDHPFPLSSEIHLFRQSMSGLRMAVIALELDDSLLKHQIVDVEPLYGSQDVPGSLLLLHSNQTVHVRAKGNWRVRPSASGLPSSWSRPIEPFLTITNYFEPGFNGDARSGVGAIVQLVTASR